MTPVQSRLMTLDQSQMSKVNLVQGKQGTGPTIVKLVNAQQTAGAGQQIVFAKPQAGKQTIVITKPGAAGVGAIRPQSQIIVVSSAANKTATTPTQVSRK